MGSEMCIRDRHEDGKLINVIEGEPAKNETVGKIEEKLGAATGCEGMVGEGKERQG